MARIRSIKPETPHDQKLGGVPIEARYLFICLITQADDHGRFRASASLIRGSIFPYDDIPLTSITGWIQMLAQADLIRLYTCRGEEYGDLPGWSKHQRIDNAGKALYPAYEDADPDNPPRIAANRREIPLDLEKDKDQERRGEGTIAVRGKPRPRNEQWDGLATVFGYTPTTRSEQSLWGRLAKDLATADATIETITEAADRYRASMPSVELTPTALVKHYQRLMAGRSTTNGKPGTAQHTLALARKAAEREALESA